MEILLGIIAFSVILIGGGIAMFVVAVPIVVLIILIQDLIKKIKEKK